MSKYKERLSDEKQTLEESGNSLEVLLRDYIPYWPVILVALVLGLFSAKVYLRYQTNIYQVGTSILLKDESQSMGNLLEQVAFKQNATFIEDEMEVIKGMDVMRGAAKKLNAQIQLLQVGRVNTQYQQYNLLPFNIVLLNPDTVYPAQLTFEIKKGRLEIEGKVVTYNRPLILGGNKVIIEKRSSIEGGFNHRRKTDEFAPSSIEDKEFKGNRFVVFRTLESATQAISNMISLSKEKTKSVINLTANVSDVEFGKRLLRTVVESYQQVTQNEKRKKARYTMDFIDSRLMYVGNDLDSVESELEIYKKQNNIQQLSKEAELFLEKVKTGDKQHSEIEIQLMILDEVDAYVKGKIKKVGISPSLIGLNDNAINNYLGKLNTAESEYAALYEQNGPENDRVKLLANEIAMLKSNLLENIKNARINLNLLRKKAESNYNRYEGEYDLLMRSIPSKERRLFAITRQQDLKNNLYIFLLQKREEAAIEMAGTLSDIRIIDSIKTGVLVSPKPTLTYLGFGMAFSLIVVIVLFVKASFNNKILSKQEIERLSSIPVVGELNFIETESPLILKDGNRTLIAEQMRALRTNLGYLKMGGKSKLLISSSFPGEGKSFVATNVAIGYALAGKKIVLIESDLRKPNISKHFKLDRRTGLSVYLSGNSDAKSIIFDVEAYPGLSVIPAGPIPPNPVELILNGRYKTLVDELAQIYDHVVIDCPPVGLVTDAMEIASFVDTALFIVRHGYTPRTAVSELLDRSVRDGKFLNAGIVYNAIKGGIGGYGYGYSYSYGYGYGYGYSYGYGYGYGQSYGSEYYGSERKTQNRFITMLDSIFIAPFKAFFGMKK